MYSDMSSCSFYFVKHIVKTEFMRCSQPNRESASKFIFPLYNINKQLFLDTVSRNSKLKPERDKTCPNAKAYMIPRRSTETKDTELHIPSSPLPHLGQNRDTHPNGTVCEPPRRATVTKGTGGMQ